MYITARKSLIVYPGLDPWHLIDLEVRKQTFPGPIISPACNTCSLPIGYTKCRHRDADVEGSCGFRSSIEPTRLEVGGGAGFSDSPGLLDAFIPSTTSLKSSRVVSSLQGQAVARHEPTTSLSEQRSRCASRKTSTRDGMHVFCPYHRVQ